MHFRVVAFCPHPPLGGVWLDQVVAQRMKGRRAKPLSSGLSCWDLLTFGPSSYLYQSFNENMRQPESSLHLIRVCKEVYLNLAYIKEFL